MIGRFIILYILCGIAWAVWGVHYNFTLNKKIIETLNSYQREIRPFIAIASMIISGIFITAFWIIDIPVFGVSKLVGKVKVKKND